MKTITDFQIIDHGLEYSQYFQGCGISYTRYEHVATGCGDTFAEAIDDALESMAQGDETDGVDFDALEKLIKAGGFANDAGEWQDSLSASDVDSSEYLELYYYVSIRYNVKDAPVCGCTSCGCSDPATTTDDSGIKVCDACSDYTVDDNGDVQCSKCDGVEVTTDSWGRSITRMMPPEEPEQDPEGDWACYWSTVGDDAHVVGRYAIQEGAAQSVAAKDWPRLGDSTRYLCGYEVRVLEDGEWVRTEDAQ